MSKLQTSAIHVEKLNQSIIEELKKKASSYNTLLEERNKNIKFLENKVGELLNKLLNDPGRNVIV